MEQNISVEENDSIVLKNNIKKRIIISTFILVTIVMLVVWFNNTYIYNNKMASNVFVGEVNISNLSKEEATKVIKEKYKPKDISLNYGNKKFTMKYKDINLNYDIDKIVKESYFFNKSKSYFKNLKNTIYLQLGNKKVFDIKADYNEKMIYDYINKLEKDINKDEMDAKLFIDSAGSINLTPSVDGVILDKNKTIEKIENSISSNEFAKVDLSVKKKVPKITTDDLKSVDSMLAMHTTIYNNSSPNRTHNIVRATNSTSDIVLMPGQEFSYNEATGPRSKLNGYKDAPVIVNGKIQDGTGGGVCQVSTTLYNSVLNSGLDITQVKNHSLESAYAPMGKDATVADGYLDLKFKNSYKHPIYIKNTAYNGFVVSKIYGSSIDKKNIEIVVEKKSSNVVNTYRKFRDSNGNVVKTEYISTSMYNKK